jgi:hypothetical protein
MPLRPNTTLTITELTLTTANTGYSYAFGGNVKAFSIQARTAVDIKIGETAASVQAGGSNYLTLKSGTVFNSPERFASSAETLYFSAGTDGIKLEIATWE